MTAEPLRADSAGVSREELSREVAHRRRRLADAMQRHGLEALLVATEANAVYLTGYETTFWGNKSKPFLVAFAPPARPCVVCHVGEAVSVELDAIDVDVERYGGPEKLAVGDGTQLDYQLPAVAAMARVLRRLEVSRIGFERSWHFIPGLTPLALDRLTELLGAPPMDASGAIWDVRRIKSEWELAQMRAAARAAELTHHAFADSARLGMTERELHRLLRRCAYDAGAERIGYSGIIAGIDRAPLGGPTDRRWQRGQLLFVDICLQLNGGYFADFNRIWASATPTTQQRRGYDGVVRALERARERLQAGTPVSALADAIIADRPTVYARVGHGLGLEMPEPPSLSTMDDTPLQAGEVICIEPNYHDDEVGWLVSEEEVVVTRAGHELLSPPFPRELPVTG